MCVSCSNSSRRSCAARPAANAGVVHSGRAPETGTLVVSRRQNARFSIRTRSLPQMRAAILPDFGQPLRLEDVPQPEPGADEVLIEVEACGVCHSDLHIVDG